MIIVLAVLNVERIIFHGPTVEGTIGLQMSEIRLTSKEQSDRVQDVLHKVRKEWYYGNSLNANRVVVFSPDRSSIWHAKTEEEKNPQRVLPPSKRLRLGWIMIPLYNMYYEVGKGRASIFQRGKRRRNIKITPEVIGGVMY